MTETDSFTTGPILPKLLRFAIPVLAALFLQALYGAVDLWAVGRFGTSADISAVSSGSQVMLILTGFITGLCMGITVALGNRIGEKNYEKAGEVLGAALWLLTILGIVLTAGILLFAPRILRLIHIPDEAFRRTLYYLRICGSGSFFIVAYNGFGGLFRGMGNSRAPLLFVWIACLTNIIGDLVLIAVFHLGAAGAAIATVGAQLVSVLFSFFYIRSHGFPFPVTRASFRFHKDTARQILKTGLPIALTDTCSEISYMILIGFTNTFGVVISAGVGVAEKIILFLCLIPMAYMSSISSFAAQNHGAGKEKRARSSMWQGMGTSVLMGLVLSYVLAFHGDVLSRLFTTEEAVISTSALFLKATALECLILSSALCFTGYFNGIGRSGFVMLQGLASIFLIKIPYAWYALHFMENKVFQIGFSTVMGALFTWIVCLIYYLHLKKGEKRIGSF